MSFTPVVEMSDFLSTKNTARVERTITQNCCGRVYFQATYWSARFYQTDGQVTALPGDVVTISGRQGLTLLVKPKSVN